jgi:myo-inositol 2-dehydrogenase / D-chiro-inositol 1-dehydrogenase
MQNIAVIGAGRIGAIHARNVAPAGLHLSHVVDADAAAASRLAAELGASVATLDAVLAEREVAGVVIASSTDTHLEYATRAVQSGKAVFCEKPIDLDLARARGAGAILGDVKLPLLLGFNRRFDPHFRALKARLESGEMGAVETLHITSHDPGPPPIAYIKVSGGLFKDMAIHDFDMARWLLGEEPVEVFAWAACHVDAEIGKAGDIDTAKTLLRTAGGRMCLISNTRRSGYGYDQRIEAFCAKGLARADNVMQSTVSTWGAAGAASDAFQNFFLDRYAEAYRLEMRHFAQVLRGEARPLVGYADAVRALVLAEAAQASASTGKVVRV